ncbi:FtsQ-type POTRA domain-containing protein [Candidatus Schneideria nysicola]|uniref:FtsQ-type POTRA domain-containing protein n=1 Tax=Candidatus Schneideria nysicola TaxID=1081631 RepID=UPI001CAA6FD7|nr:FtsQ-type POTRA domain-containing protein [Candidatus Schneideria nysicola]UAJ65129.1 FtsQ-type POTRA domain-containing protein [Candidatus Schneideria nysicola]
MKNKKIEDRYDYQITAIYFNKTPKYQNRIVILIFFLLVLVVGIYGSTWIIFRWIQPSHNTPSLFKIIVQGGNFTTEDDIRKLLHIRDRNMLMKTDVNIIQNTMLQLPWIKSISVRKKWPNIIKINLIEYIPLVCWNNIYLIDKNGKKFPLSQFSQYKKEKISSTIPTLYILEEHANEKHIINEYIAISNVLNSSSKIQIKTIHINPCHSWSLILDNNIRLEIGRNNKIYRLKRFIEIYPTILQHAYEKKKQISSIDLRYESGLAVGLTDFSFATTLLFHKSERLSYTGKNTND